MWFALLTLGVVIICGALSQGDQPARRQEKFRVDVEQAIRALLAREDIDADKKITVKDIDVAGRERPDLHYTVTDLEGRGHEIVGTYHLANLLEELSLARDQGRATTEIDMARIEEPPPERISRMIREQFWDNLTRRIDERGLERTLADKKARSADGKNHLYVAPGDTAAIRYFENVAQRDSALRLDVGILPQTVTPEYVRSLDGRHGLLSLALERDSAGALEGVPFVVPGGRFNEMYGWDSYFEALGLLRDGRVDLARGMVDNFVYEINHYGKILNANRTYYLTRSQPPLLTSMIRAVYARLPKESSTRKWLEQGLNAAIREYRTVWMGPDRLTETGLSRYYDAGSGPAPEVEEGHYDAVFGRFARKAKMDPKEFEREYRAGRLNEQELDTFFRNDRAVRESGHDTSYRLEGICTEIVTVDLNALLYKIERDVAAILREEFNGSLRTPDGLETAGAWEERAEARKRRMTSLMWNDERGMFFDYNVVTHRQHPYESATSLYPLWAGLATAEQARSSVERLLPLLEMPGGIVSSTEASRGPLSADRPARQWDYPNGWPPHQMLIWAGLERYGYGEIAQRLAYRWLYTIARNAADYNGTVPEKFDVVRRTHDVFAEYGNVGTKFSYITREGFGWMNASFQVGLSILPERLRRDLSALTPPEKMFGK